MYRNGNDFVTNTVVVKVERSSVCRNGIAEMPGIAAESDTEVVLMGFLGKKTMPDSVVIEFVEIGYAVGFFIEVTEREVSKRNGQAKVGRETEVGRGDRCCFVVANPCAEEVGVEARLAWTGELVD